VTQLFEVSGSGGPAIEVFHFQSDRLFRIVLGAVRSLGEDIYREGAEENGEGR